MIHDKECGIGGVAAKRFDVLEFCELGPRTIHCLEFFYLAPKVFLELCRIREETRMGFVGAESRYILRVKDLVVVFVQCRHGGTQRQKDPCEVIDSYIFMGSGLSNPFDVGDSLNHIPIGEDDTEYRQASTATSEEKRRAATLFKEGLRLRTLSVEVQKRVEITNLLRGKKLPNGKCSLG